MRLPFELTIALRYFRSRRRAGVSLPAFLAVAGVLVGVAALTVVSSVWNGFEAEFLEKLLGINAHAIVLKRGDAFRDHREVAAQLLANPEITDAAPFLYNEVIVQSATNIQGVAVKGLDPAISATTPLARYLSADSFAALADRSHSSILIGKALQEALHVEVGDAVSVISPFSGGSGEAETADFSIAAIFESGMYEFDSRMVFIELGRAQQLFHQGRAVSGLEVWTRDPLRSYEVTRAALDLDEYDVRDWSRTNQGLFGAVRSQKILISIVLFIIVLVAAFNIMATLILLILEKEREIAILKSLGARNASILAIFVCDGLMVGLLGCALGLVVGLTICAVLQEYGLKLDPRVYYLSNLPMVVRPLELVIISAGTLLLAVLATLFPAFKAAAMLPVDGLAQRTALKRGHYRV